MADFSQKVLMTMVLIGFIIFLKDIEVSAQNYDGIISDCDLDASSCTETPAIYDSDESHESDDDDSRRKRSSSSFY
ncbi:hypothetical protein HCN44_001848 [Aphidius gifuensis]|uniref:Odorant-binding protein n=1 Tax=Aphidius gifuensis TaxID=684658 RepID=A0A834Y1G7_APHGI|nr:hypothetical protein HCN44_001848 [Aphidius gifuensis]